MDERFRCNGRNRYTLRDEQIAHRIISHTAECEHNIPSPGPLRRLQVKRLLIRPALPKHTAGKRHEPGPLARKCFANSASLLRTNSRLRKFHSCSAVRWRIPRRPSSSRCSTRVCASVRTALSFQRPSTRARNRYQSCVALRLRTSAPNRAVSAVAASSRMPPWPKCRSTPRVSSGPGTSASLPCKRRPCSEYPLVKKRRPQRPARPSAPPRSQRLRRALKGTLVGSFFARTDLYSTS